MLVRMMSVGFVIACLVVCPKASAGQPPTLVDLSDRFCIGPDGDHRLTWFLAEQDGYTELTSEDLPEGHRAIGVHDNSLRGFKKTVDSIEYRVFTAASWIIAPDQGQTYYRWCWVLSSSGTRDQAVNELGSQLGFRSFRSERVRLFAWIPRPGDDLEPVSRRDYMRWHNVFAREQGMRQVLVRRIGDGVSIGYASPRDEATYRDFDWAGPEPVPAPR